MTIEKVFFYTIASIMLAYGINIQIDIYLDRHKVRKIKGKIINFEYVLPESMMHRNAKLVRFEYYLEGIRYISKNTIKMSISAEIGDIVDIKVFIDNPYILYTKTKNHIYLAISASLLCFLLGFIS